MLSSSIRIFLIPSRRRRTSTGNLSNFIILFLSQRTGRLSTPQFYKKSFHSLCHIFIEVPFFRVRNKEPRSKSGVLRLVLLIVSCYGPRKTSNIQREPGRRWRLIRRILLKILICQTGLGIWCVQPSSTLNHCKCLAGDCQCPRPILPRSVGQHKIVDSPISNRAYPWTLIKGSATLLKKSSFLFRTQFEQPDHH